MKRANRKKAFLENNISTNAQYFENSNIIQYNFNTFKQKNNPHLNEIIFINKNNLISWFNIYGFQPL